MVSDHSERRSERYSVCLRILMAERYGGLFLVQFGPVEQYSLSADSSLKLWHERMAHQNICYVNDILERNNIKYIDGRINWRII